MAMTRFTVVQALIYVDQLWDDTLIERNDSDVYILEIAATDGIEDVIDETQGEADRLFVIGTNTEGIYGQIQSDGSLYLDFETVFTC